MGTSGTGASKATGGSNTKTITQANLPNVKLTVNSFSLSKGTQDITGEVYFASKPSGRTITSGAFYPVTKYEEFNSGAVGGGDVDYAGFQASKTWTGSTNSVSPQTSALGSGSALDITPAYYTCHMWLRTS